MSNDESPHEVVITYGVQPGKRERWRGYCVTPGCSWHSDRERNCDAITDAEHHVSGKATADGIDEERVWAMLIEELQHQEEHPTASTAVKFGRAGRIAAYCKALATDAGAYYSFEPDKVLLEAHHRKRGGGPRR
jgi:hypothetical protein